ncbi:MAG: Nif3-like dinuclear metal center hexameric protein [Gemmatimonadaceae bacterium]
MNKRKANADGTKLFEIVDYLDKLLETSTTPDYPNSFNGLQLSNSGVVTKVAAAVDFSTRTVSSAISEKANLLIVHHGMFWTGVQPITKKIYHRLHDLFDADVAVYSSHLPLDRHAYLGNNILLARQLGLEPSQPFANFKNISIGVQGVSEMPTSTLVNRARRFARTHGGDIVATDTSDANRVTRRWALCTGAGASAETLNEAAHDGVDTLIVGEGPHWTAVDAPDRGLTIIYVGHYASETLGVFALADDVSQKFQLGCAKISAPTGL